MAIILYLGFLIGLISNFEKLCQHDLNIKFYAQICKKRILTSNKPPGRFQRNLG